MNDTINQKENQTGRTSTRSQYMFVIKELTSREIKRKYARSHLGIAWSLLNPLLHMAVMSLVFSTMWDRAIEKFPIYYLTGYLFWELFSVSTSSAMTALVDNRNLLLKVKLPKQTFVLARMYTALVNFGYSCIAYVVMLLVFKIKPSWTMLLFPIDVIFTLLFAMGIGYALSIIFVFFADIKHLYSSVLLTLWMYLSALFYPVSRLHGIMQKIVSHNPIYVMISFARESVMYGRVPALSLWIQLIVWGLGSFVVGYIIFKQKENMVMQKI